MIEKVIDLERPTLPIACAKYCSIALEEIGFKHVKLKPGSLEKQAKDKTTKCIEIKSEKDIQIFLNKYASDFELY